MIEFKNVLFAYGSSAATQSLTNSASKDSMGATESLSQPEIPPTLDNVSFNLSLALERLCLAIMVQASQRSQIYVMHRLFRYLESLVDGISTAGVPSTQISSHVGMVRQDPTAQLVCATVFDEVAFGPANLGLPKEEIVSRVSQTLELCGIADLIDALPTRFLEANSSLFLLQQRFSASTLSSA